MLNACSKEAPRVRKCYKPMLHLFSFNRTARRNSAGGRARGPAGRAAARRRARYRASAVTFSRRFSHRRASTPGTLCPLTSTSGHDVTL